MRSLKLLLLIIAIALFVFSCDDDSKTEFTTTPYELRIPAGLPQPVIPDDNRLTVEGVNLGKELFFDKILSRDNTQSCASCHNQSFAFTDNLRDFSIGINGDKGSRNSMALFNLFYHNNGFFWDGRAATLREQSLMPIEDPLEMDSDLDEVVQKLNSTSKYPRLFNEAFGSSEITSEKMALAMEQYMFTLVSGNSKFDRVQAGLEEFTELEARGHSLFFEESKPEIFLVGADCFHCHSGPNFTNDEYINNGLDSEFTDKGYYETTGNTADIGKFKVPSLRNIAVSGPYMHDGRFRTLEEVVRHYNSGVKESPTLDPNVKSSRVGLQLSDEDVEAVVAFLRTLTDDEFLNNPEYQR